LSARDAPDVECSPALEQNTDPHVDRLSSIDGVNTCASAVPVEGRVGAGV
jgi:hypothetical protein